MSTKPTLTSDQEYCRKALSFWVCGDHRLPNVSQCGYGIEINYSNDLSTFDMNKLTQLVVIAHRFCVRIEIGSSGPGRVKIMAHRRDPKATSLYKRHPDLSGLIDDCKEAITWPDLEETK